MVKTQGCTGALRPVRHIKGNVIIHKIKRGMFHLLYVTYSILLIQNFLQNAPFSQYINKI